MRRHMPPTGAVLISFLVGSVSACASISRGESQWCLAPSERESISPSATGLAGRYELVFRATSGNRRGRLARGVLELIRRDSVAGILRTLNGAPHPYLRELYFGSATIDLESVGAFTEGSVNSHEATAPGVTVRAWTDRREGQLKLRLGSNANRRDIATLDGAFIDANFFEIVSTGFRGEWEASLGHTSYRAAGYFCGRRLR